MCPTTQSSFLYSVVCSGFYTVTDTISTLLTVTTSTVNAVCLTFSYASRPIWSCVLVTQSFDTIRVHRWQTCWTRSHRKLRQSDRFAHCSEHPPITPALPDTGHWSRPTTFPGQSVCFTNSWLTLVSVRAQPTRYHESEMNSLKETREVIAAVCRAMFGHHNVFQLWLLVCHCGPFPRDLSLCTYTQSSGLMRFADQHRVLLSFCLI